MLNNPIQCDFDLTLEFGLVVAERRQQRPTHLESTEVGAQAGRFPQ
jgi:hypothetical protein